MRKWMRLLLLSLYRKGWLSIPVSIKAEAEAKTYSHVLDRHYEYPFVIRNVVSRSNIRQILDVGCTGSVLPLILASMGYSVTGCDINRWEVSCQNFQFVVDDIKNSKFEDGSFDLVTAVSTIEHCGLPRYGEKAVADGDKLATKEICRILRRGGYFILTVPFGRPITYLNQYRVYDSASFKTLTEGFEVIQQVYYGPIRQRDVYQECSEEDTYRIDPSTGLRCVACVVLQKRG